MNVSNPTPRRAIKILGSGSFGFVNLMSDGTVEKKSVIESDDRPLHKQYRRAAFQREVEILAMLSPHPNIVRFYGSEVREGPHGELFGYLTISQAPGLRVDRWLDEHDDEKYDATLTLMWYPFVQTLLLVIEYIHSKGIHHLDLHPGNVIIDPSIKSLKVIDFGLSCGRNCDKEEDADCPTSMHNWQPHVDGDLACGFTGQTPHYTSFYGDEQMTNSAIIKAHEMRSMDLYSVGALAHLWWFGYPPYAKDGYKEAPAWLWFTAMLMEEPYPPSLTDDKEYENAIATMRFLLCNPRLTEQACLRGRHIKLPEHMRHLAPAVDLWTNPK